MFKGTPKKQPSTENGKVEYGESYGSYGYSFRHTWQGPRMPGPTETDISLRRIVPKGRVDPEIQIAIEIVQRYRSGSNARRMNGSLVLRGEALKEFCRRVLEEELRN